MHSHAVSELASCLETELSAERERGEIITSSQWIGVVYAYHGFSKIVIEHEADMRVGISMYLFYRDLPGGFDWYFQRNHSA